MRKNNTHANSSLLRRFAFFLFVLFIISALLSGHAMAQSSAGLTAGSASGAPGQTVTIPVSFTPAATAAPSLQFDLLFPSSLTYVSHSSGAAATNASKIVTRSSISGGLRFMIWGDINAIGAGVLVNVQLSISGSASAGTIPVTFSQVTVSDVDGNPITCVSTNGSVTVPDTTAPSITISSPTSDSTHSTSSASLNLGGTASDNVGVTQVTWSNDRGGSGTASGTTSWSVNGITLQSGDNVITVTARDAANLSSTDTITVTYTPPQQDTVAPTATITSPTSNPIYSTGSASLNLGGTTSDNVGVTQVTWSNNRGGSGTATGTTNWSVTGITLQTGLNVITVTADDAAGLSGTDTIAVTYTLQDTTAPTVAIASPTSSDAYDTSSASLNLGGTASDNVGVTQVTWSNNRGGSGTATGTTSWSITGITLQTGVNVITVTSADAANLSGTDAITVTYTPASQDQTAPTIAITSPISDNIYSTGSASLNLGGTASDNVGVTQVTWANNRGGNGTATGTTDWSVTGITLQSGINMITVMARDAAGLTGTDTLAVTYAPQDSVSPTITITSPTSDSAYSASSATLNLGGSASDNVGVTQVTWANSRGGNGVATGTTNWSVTGITLQSGANMITVTARDAAGNLGTDTLIAAYEIEDTAPPVISNVSASKLTPASATITWQTDKASNSQVQYGLDTSYSGSLSDASYVTAHSIALTGLTAGTLYHYRVISADEDGNSVASDDFMFTTASLAAADFNGDKKSDMLWRNIRTGEVSISILSKTPPSATSVGTVADLTWKIAGTGDFDGDGQPDILWRHYGMGENYIWFMDRTVYTAGTYIEAERDLDYKIVGVGDFNGDGKPDILWRHKINGSLGVWIMNGIDRAAIATIETPGDLNWQVAAIADFDKDKYADILWRNYATGECRIELLNGTAVKEYRNLDTVADLNFIIVSVGDYLGDGQLEIIWKNARTNNYSIWYLDGAAKIAEDSLGQIQDANNLYMDFGQASSGLDFDNDGNADVLWTDSETGDNYVWLMNGTSYNGGAYLPATPNPGWKIEAAADIDHDGKMDLVLRNQSTGENAAWYMNGLTRTGSVVLPTISDTNWKIVAAADLNKDGSADLVWRNYATGENVIWLMNGKNRVEVISLNSVQDANWKVIGAADFNKDGYQDLLWTHNITGESAVWFMNGTSYVSQSYLGKITDTNWKMAGLGDFNKDGNPDILWRNPSTGDNQVWYMEGLTRISTGSLPSVAGQRWVLMKQN